MATDQSADALTQRALEVLEPSGLAAENARRGWPCLRDAVEAKHPLLPILQVLEQRARFTLIGLFAAADPPESLAALRREVAAWKKRLPEARRQHDEHYRGRPIARRVLLFDSPEFVDAAVLVIELAHRARRRLRSAPERAALDAYMAEGILAILERSWEHARAKHQTQLRRSLGGIRRATPQKLLSQVAYAVRAYEKKYGPAKVAPIADRIAPDFGKAPRTMRRLIATAKRLMESGQKL